MKVNIRYAGLTPGPVGAGAVQVFELSTPDGVFKPEVCTRERLEAIGLNVPKRVLREIERAGHQANNAGDCDDHVLRPSGG